MNGVNHAATALLIRKKWPDSPLVLLLLGTVLSDLVWVVLVLTGVELVDYLPPVRSLADIDFVSMPYSHDLVATFFAALGIGLIAYGWRHQRFLILAFGLAVLSHPLLDIVVHKPDVPLSWIQGSGRFGSGLYGIPVAAFLVEIVYMSLCWHFSQSRRRVFFWLLGLNLLAITLYVPAISGPEVWFSSYPWLFPVLVLIDSLVAVFVINYCVRTPR